MSDDPRPEQDLTPRDPARPRPRRTAGQLTAEDPATGQFVVEIAQLMADLRCENVTILDVRGLSDLMDYLVIGSGTSERQIKSVADDVEELAEQHQMTRYGKESDEASTWVVVDFVDVVVHLFDPPTRAHYELEMLWGDAPRIDWSR